MASLKDLHYDSGCQRVLGMSAIDSWYFKVMVATNFIIDQERIPYRDAEKIGLFKINNLQHDDYTASSGEEVENLIIYYRYRGKEYLKTYPLDQFDRFMSEYIPMTHGQLTDYNNRKKDYEPYVKGF